MKIVLANQFKNESSRLVEWLEYYRDRGIRDFVLCNDHSSDDSVEKIRSVKGINCKVIDSSYTPTEFHNSKDTQSYAGNSHLASSISTNFKRIHKIVLDSYGTSTILGFFDVDEFVLRRSNRLSEEMMQSLSGYLMVSVCSFEVDSDRFDPNNSIPLLKQTTRSMSTGNRFKSERMSFKSFCDLSHPKSNILFQSPINYYGPNIHACGVDIEKQFECSSPIQPKEDSDTWSVGMNWKLASPQELTMLHYRKPSYIARENFHLFDKDYAVP